jgi:hypothetical protein
MKRNELKTVHELTPKQRMFVEILVQEHGNITQHEAYKRAGYEAANENTAKSCASQLLSRKLNPHVAKYFDQRFEQEIKKYESDNLRRYKRLERIANKAEEDKQYAAAINAEYRSGGKTLSKRCLKLYRPVSVFTDPRSLKPRSSFSFPYHWPTVQQQLVKELVQPEAEEQELVLVSRPC